MSETFQILDLGQFSAFLAAQGYKTEPEGGEYEVARFRLPDPSGTNAPVLVYRRKFGDLLTVYKNGNAFDYLEDIIPHAFAPKSPKAEEASPSSASTEDAPW